VFVSQPGIFFIQIHRAIASSTAAVGETLGCGTSNLWKTVRRRAIVLCLLALASGPGFAQYCGNYDQVVGWMGNFSQTANGVAQATNVTFTVNETAAADVNLSSLPSTTSLATTCASPGPTVSWYVLPPIIGGFSNEMVSIANDTVVSTCPGGGTQTQTITVAPGATFTNQSSAWLTIDFSALTYYFYATPIAPGVDNDTGCPGGTGSTTQLPFTFYYVPPPPPSPYSIALPVSAPQLTGSPPSFGAIAAPSPLNIPWNVTFTLAPIWDDGVDDPCRQLFASTLGCQNQTLAEDVVLVGTSFGLHYQSDRVVGRAAANAAATAQSKMIGGWALSVHHAFDPNSGRLYLGGGGTRSGWQLATPVTSGTNVLVTSEDGSEVYVFDSTRKHLQTLTPLLGALIYQFGYDTAGNLVTVTDGSGNVTTIQRDASENATAIVGPFGQTTTLTHDANGYLSTIVDPAGQTSSFSYDANGLVLSRTDPRGFVYNYAYDGFGRISSESDPVGAAKRVVRVDSINLTTSLGAAPGYFTVSETDPMGQVTAFKTNLLPKSGNGGGDSGTVTWPNGLAPTYSRTQQSFQIVENTSLPDGSSDSITGAPDPRWLLQLPVPASATYTRGAQVMTATASRVASISTSGNPFSLTTQTDTATINGNTYSWVFTAATNTQVSTSPVGRTSAVVTDALERPATLQVPGLADTVLAYDVHGRLATVTSGGRVATITYDANGRPSSLTDPLGQTRSFTYDADGRLLSKTLPDGRVIAFAHDAVGNLTSVTPPGGAPHQFTYSPVNLVSSYLPPSAPATATTSTSYQYNLDRQLTQIVRPDAGTIGYTYDSAGRVNSVVTPAATISYAYDAVTGNLASANIGGGEGLAYIYNGPLPVSTTWTGAVTGSVSRTYDNNFRLTGETVGAGGAAVSYGYDADGLMTSAQAGTGSMSLARSATNGFLTGTSLGTVADSYTYDQYGELTGYSASAGASIYSYTNTFDALGRVSARSETIGGTTTQYAYQYDLAGRLVGVTRNSTPVSEYHYDANSNRALGATASGVSRGRYDKQDRMIAYGHAHYSYTANGELSSKSEGATVTRYTYDVLGNLTGVTISPTGASITYVLDAKKRRVGKRVNGVLTAGYLYDGRRLVAQLDVNNALVSQFVYALGSASPAFMIRAGVVYRMLSDQLGSPRLIVNAATGAVAEQIDYDEFGVVLNDTNPGFQPFGFAGGLYDPDTQLIRFGARDYDPATGRWTAKDPIRFDGGDTNLYAYVQQNPVNGTDASGTGPEAEGGSCDADNGNGTTATKLSLGQAVSAALEALATAAEHFAEGASAAAAKLAGALATIVHGSEVGAEGVLNTRDYVKNLNKHTKVCDQNTGEICE
jgi:RHS repeat-associated protein